MKPLNKSQSIFDKAAAGLDVTPIIHAGLYAITLPQELLTSKDIDPRLPLALRMWFIDPTTRRDGVLYFVAGSKAEAYKYATALTQDLLINKVIKSLCRADDVPCGVLDVPASTLDADGINARAEIMRRYLGDAVIDFAECLHAVDFDSARGEIFLLSSF